MPLRRRLTEITTSQQDLHRLSGETPRQAALRCSFQPPHDIAELIERAVLDVYSPAAGAVIDRDGETQ